MQLVEVIVAVHGPTGRPGLFRLVYGAGQVPGVEGLRNAVGNALRRAGMSVDAGFVLFDPSYTRYDQLLRTVIGEPITLNGVLPDDPSFSSSLLTHPDFVR